MCVRLCVLAAAVRDARRWRVSLVVRSCHQRLHHSSSSACDHPAASPDDWNTCTEIHWTAGFSLGQLKHCGRITHTNVSMVWYMLTLGSLTKTLKLYHTMYVSKLDDGVRKIAGDVPVIALGYTEC